MGHKRTWQDVLWADNGVQAQIDFGYRATHVAALSGKAIAEQYYNKVPARSYFVGCSTGGYQGVMEAQRFPWDFDGIIAGAPDIDDAAANLRGLWIVRTFLDKSGEPLMTSDELRLVHQAALAQCDMDDGVKDGIIGNPLACKFDPSELICKGGRTNACLTPSHAEVVKKLFAGPMTSKGQKTSAGGFPPGSELAWEQFWAGTAPVRGLEQFFRYGISGYSASPQWKYTDFDFDRDYKRLGLAPYYDNSNPDLRKFKQAGGKLIIYHGGTDTINLLGPVVDYYETVERTMGGREATQDFFRLFVIPGMNHCTLGEGPFAVDYLSYLEAWVERDKAPEKVIGSHVMLADLKLADSNDVREMTRRLEFPLDPTTVEFSRPVYPYPLLAKYLGQGNPKDAASFGPIRRQEQEIHGVH
jgi:hypothetical protein